MLDTHVWIWLLNADRRLGSHARAAIERAAGDDGVGLSTITPWEVSMLAARGRLALGREPRDWLEYHVSRPGFVLHPLSVAIAVDSNTLPPAPDGLPHGDPADRIIVATARQLDVPLVTADRRILAYGVAGQVKTLDAAA